MKVWRRSAFLVALRAEGTITAACRIVHVGRQTVYDLIASDERFRGQVEQARAEHDAAEAAHVSALAERAARQARRAS